MLKMLENGKIGGITLKNKIIMAPMGTKSDSDGSFSLRDIRYFEERAKGGVGMIITGRVGTQDKYEMRTNHLLYVYHHLTRLSLLIEKVHHYGTKLCVQLGPGIGRMVYQDPFTPPYSSSEIPAFWFPELMCKPYSKEQIRFLVKSMGWSASLAKRAGADAVEIHAYGGYLNDQFHCSLWNKRTDEYGGNLEGRLRFTLEIIASIRESCGKEFPVIVKFTPYHGIPGGTELPEGIQIAKIFESAGVDALHVDKGCFEVWNDVISTVYEPDAHQLAIAEAIKKEVNIPVIAHGKLHKLEVVEKALEELKTDFVALGHQMMTDPYWVTKVKAGNVNDIRPCIGCNDCLFMSHQGRQQSCAVNPQCLREDDYPILPANESRSVLVIGGGPGGMQAAITADQRGFDVELWEKDYRLGGALLAAGAPKFKEDVSRFVTYMTNKICNSNVKIKLNKEAGVEDILRAKYDKVIIATGSKPITPKIQGIDGETVKDSISVLLGNEKVGKNVAVIGGGLVGCEVALHVKETAENVFIIEMLGDILVTAQHNRNNDISLRKKITNSGIKIIGKAKVSSIHSDFIEYILHDEVKRINCDTVINAAGWKANDDLVKALENKLEDLSVIGDAIAPRRIYDAVHEGFHAVRLM